MADRFAPFFKRAIFDTRMRNSSLLASDGPKLEPCGLVQPMRQQIIAGIGGWSPNNGCPSVFRHLETLGAQEGCQPEAQCLARFRQTHSANGRLRRQRGYGGQSSPPLIGPPAETRKTAKAGAGEGNRTLVCSLGSCRSTIELRPRAATIANAGSRRQARSRGRHCLVFVRPTP
jgi:hypothetical protein